MPDFLLPSKPITKNIQNRQDATGGDVHIVGAGPGDPELLTVKAYRLIQRADVIIYDRLVGTEILGLAPAKCEMIYAGKRKNLHTMTQAEIGSTMVEKATSGVRVVRLKGGDSLIFSRISEELEVLAAAGIPWHIVPGITSVSGAAASQDIPLTCREHSHAITYVTAHNKNGVLEIDWELITRGQQTVVFYMGLSLADTITKELLKRGVPAHKPFYVIANATRSNELVIEADLGSIAELLKRRKVPSPALLIMGPRKHNQPLSQHVNTHEYHASSA